MICIFIVYYFIHTKTLHEITSCFVVHGILSILRCEIEIEIMIIVLGHERLKLQRAR